MSNTDKALVELAEIQAQNAQTQATLNKVSGETSLLLEKIEELENSAPADTPQAVLDAIAAVKAQAATLANTASGIDAKVPDGGPPPNP